MKVFLGVLLAGAGIIALAAILARSSAVAPASAPRTAAPAAVATRTPDPAPSVSPARGRAVVYVSAPSAPPLAVDDPKGIEGDSASGRVYYRLQHLWAFRGPVPPGYVPLASAVKARPYRVGLADDLAVITFLVPPDGWGIDAAQVKMLLQQIVYTATEEPGVERVRIREEGTQTSLDPEEGPPVVIAGMRIPLILTRDSVR
jgi:hypothetical protein